jgi:hypothetical protein
MGKCSINTSFHPCGQKSKKLAKAGWMEYMYTGPLFHIYSQVDVISPLRLSTESPEMCRLKPEPFVCRMLHLESGLFTRKKRLSGSFFHFLQSLDWEQKNLVPK